MSQTNERRRIEIRESDFAKLRAQCSDSIMQIIEDLASEGRLNGQTFCIQCMVITNLLYDIYVIDDFNRLENLSVLNIVECATSV